MARIAPGSRSGGRRLSGEVGEEVLDALVVENDRRAARPNEYRYPVPEHERPRVVDLEPRPARHHNRERAEGGALLERGYLRRAKGDVEGARADWLTVIQLTPGTEIANEALRSQPGCETASITSVQPVRFCRGIEFHQT